MNDLQRFIYSSIISADNDDYTEDQKQEVMRRYKLTEDNPDWEFILQPVDDTGKLKDLFE